MTVIAIDGPAGAGKSSIARRLAERLGHRYLDTGAMYRVVTLAAMERGLDSGEDEEALGRLARELDFRLERDGRVLLEGRDVSEAIRSAAVTRVVSPVSAVAAVREAMVERQRAVAREGPLVCEGRDMGTVVFPGAEVKIYLDASPAVRAARRAEEMEAKGQRVDRAALVEEIERRDRFDSEREHAPLKRVEDQIHLDTSSLGFEDVLELVERRVRERLGEEGAPG